MDLFYGFVVDEGPTLVPAILLAAWYGLCLRLIFADAENVPG